MGAIGIVRVAWPRICLKILLTTQILAALIEEKEGTRPTMIVRRYD